MFQRISNYLFWVAFLTFGLFITIQGGHNTLDRLAYTEVQSQKAYIEAIYRYRRYLTLAPDTQKTQIIKSAIRQNQARFAADSNNIQWLNAIHAEYQMLYHQLPQSGTKDTLRLLITTAEFKKSSYQKNKALRMDTTRRIPYRWLTHS